MVGAYSASKHAVEALTDALRIELRPAGIGVSVVEPGPVRTPIWDKGRRTLGELQGLHDAGDLNRYGAPLRVFERLLALNERRGIPVEQVVHAVERALRARVPRTRYLVGADARIRVLLRWLLPDRWNDALIRAVLRVAERRLA
jgi:NAD(P)-dependent dehydrogenase (short-subunit alcohol dehydrogenase family)